MTLLNPVEKRTSVLIFLRLPHSRRTRVGYSLSASLAVFMTLSPDADSAAAAAALVFFVLYVSK